MSESSAVEEVATAISMLVELEYVSSDDIQIRKSYRGTQAANGTLPVIAANKLLQGGKVSIGWVKCRVRLRAINCYRCHQQRTARVRLTDRKNAFAAVKRGIKEGLRYQQQAGICRAWSNK